ncbi:putative RNA nucleotidyltransferase [Treponema primitia ZAS-2]|uniref:Putative RNA nucleotidyltransferase n=1 Tax=Treponema primitia (strain ATCC BAA-887 / DSM 12427 / ZAS-2) TaxID=545694 RepID=F5YLK4_TREPZ|nr:HDIG domain-containing metalloprotein [Treponema primitia]AEF83626.1 putative RNA nucleotidyltransferase [Treponema primitia ZAS-2]
MDHSAIFGPLVSAGHSVSLCGFSALDCYMGFTPLPFTRVDTNADIPALARLLEGLRFPGTDIADGAVDAGEHSYYFRCIDPEDFFHNSNPSSPSYTLLSFYQNWNTKRFRDPLDMYPLIRALRFTGDPRKIPGSKKDPLRLDPGNQKEFALPTSEYLSWQSGLNPRADHFQALMDAALILARYDEPGDSIIGRNTQPLKEILRSLDTLSPGLPPKSEAQRLLLMGILVSPNPGRGLELLKAAGFIREFWPELDLLDDVDHSKEFHPEGNVWKHTLETLRYRKTTTHNRAAYDFRLSLGLLLHDVGKPLSASSGSRRFNGHAELGAQAARKFLERMEFKSSLIEDIYYLVKNHMLPAALPRLPLIRTQEILESPLFPTLLELYRCDESSSFKGLDGYYESSAAYQSYLRNRRNPYRSADGKKLGKQGTRKY